MTFRELAALLSVTIALSSQVLAETDVIATTADGKVSGIQEESPGGRTFFSFYGIPFAKPPVGKLRFKDPLPAEPWDGIKDATAMKPQCPQLDFLHADKISGSEDCLHLNVFTPKLGEAKDPLPVMVCIHGGGFFLGSGAMCGPNYLNDHDVVLVAIQYRLGTLGFLSTEDEVIPGNFGLKDQSMALRWVQRNIRNFGGDPDRVTIFGLSAGGASVHYHLLSPYSEGLFKRAIMESGSALCPWAMGDSFKEVADYTVSIAGCSDNSQELLECLQSADTNSLVSLAGDLRVFHISPFIFGPRADGDFLPDQPHKLVKEGRYHNVDVILGVTSHEGSLFSRGVYTSEESLNDFNNNYATKAPAVFDFHKGDVAQPSVIERIFRHYTGTTQFTVSHADSVTQMLGDWQFSIPHDLTREYLVRHNTSLNVYSYEFTYHGEHTLAFMFPSLDVGKHWVGHGDDGVYRYKLPFFPPLSSPVEIQLKDMLVKLWVNFATEGNPTPDDSFGFKWEPFTQKSRRHLNIKPQPVMEEEFRQEVRDFWASLPLLGNVILHPEKVLDLDRYWLELANQKPEFSTGEKAFKKPTKYFIRDEL